MRSSDTSSTDVQQVRREWVEPKVVQFEVQDTASNKGLGGDGEAASPDCTLS